MPHLSSAKRCLLLAAILLISLVLRIQYNEVTRIDNPMRGDAVSYVIYAHNLTEHFTFSKDRDHDNPSSDAFWAPGYPVFLAATTVTAESLGFNRYQVILNAQAVMGTMTVALCYLLALLILPTAWALIAALFMAISPHAVSLGANFLSETLFTCLLTLSVYVLVIAHKRESATLCLLAGIAFSLTYLVNPVSIILAPLIVIAQFFQRTSACQRTLTNRRLTALVGAPILIVAGLWYLRAVFQVSATDESTSDRLLTNLTVGMFRDYHEWWRVDRRDLTNPAALAINRIGDSFTLWFNELLHMFAANPLTMARWYLLEKPLLLWDWNIRTGQGDIYVFPVFYSLYDRSSLALASYAIMHSLHVWLIAASGIGLLLLPGEENNRRNACIACYLSILGISAVYIISQAEPRYSIPLRPFLYVTALYSLWRITEYVKTHLNSRKQTYVQ